MRYVIRRSRRRIAYTLALLVGYRHRVREALISAYTVTSIPRSLDIPARNKVATCR